MTTNKVRRVVLCGELVEVVIEKEHRGLLEHWQCLFFYLGSEYMTVCFVINCSTVYFMCFSVYVPNKTTLKKYGKIKAELIRKLMTSNVLNKHLSLFSHYPIFKQISVSDSKKIRTDNKRQIKKVEKNNINPKKIETIDFFKGRR